MNGSKVELSDAQTLSIFLKRFAQKSVPFIAWQG